MKAKDMINNRTDKQTLKWTRISVFVAIVTALIVPIWQINNEKVKQFNDEKAIANSLYGYFLSIRINLANKQYGKIDIKRLNLYLSSGKLLANQVYGQIGNLDTSLKIKNYTAAKEQVDDIISKLENIYGCQKSTIQSGIDRNHPPISADVSVLR
ncbi:MAG TPA: hypothetical protein VMD04_02720 [Candidatus Margulisiibacteriota bacterium]|nr:hypothetical protein [Candidatus Margulisiibacteriota bacterium]